MLCLTHQKVFQRKLLVPLMCLPYLMLLWLPNYWGVIFGAQKKFVTSLFCFLETVDANPSWTEAEPWDHSYFLTLSTPVFSFMPPCLEFSLYSRVLSGYPQALLQIWFVALFSSRKMGGWRGRMLISPALKLAKKSRKDLKPKEIAPLIIFS